MTVEELKRHGFIYFEGGLWKRDVLLWRDCCGSVVEYADAQRRTTDFSWSHFGENHRIRILLAGTSPR